MGNASGRENGSGAVAAGGGDGMLETTGISSNGGATGSRETQALTVRVGSADLMMNSPPLSPRHFDTAPRVFNPQVTRLSLYCTSFVLLAVYIYAYTCTEYMALNRSAVHVHILWL